MRMYWYEYNGSSGNESLVGNYSLADFPQDACGSGSNLCQIYVLGGLVPNSISSTILAYITAAKAEHHYRPNGVNKKPYVYTTHNFKV